MSKAASSSAAAAAAATSSSSFPRNASRRLLKELDEWNTTESKEEKGVERLGPVNDDQLLCWEAVINGRGVGCGYDGSFLYLFIYFGLLSLFRYFFLSHPSDGSFFGSFYLFYLFIPGRRGKGRGREGKEDYRSLFCLLSFVSFRFRVC